MKDTRIIILIPPELLKSLKKAATKEDLSVSQLVRRAIRNELLRINPPSQLAR
jgi:hypothetical protein